MNFREATFEDIKYMAENSINQTEKKLVERVDYVYALEHDGNLLGIGGFRLIVPTCAWCWIDLSRYGIDNLKELYRTIREWMETFSISMGIVRLQAFVRNNEKHIRMVKHLGFKRESTMKNFYGGDDAYLYVRIF